MQRNPLITYNAQFSYFLRSFTVLVFLCFSSMLLAQKNNKQEIVETPPPDWVSHRPISSTKYIGIGVASKIGNPNYQFEAKKNALYDLSSEIQVNISSNSMLYSVQNNNLFSQSFNSIINLKSIENIEGYRLVDTYENDKQYWVYYELDKEEYARQKALKKKNTIAKAAEIIKLSLIDDQQKNYTAGLRKKIQAFSVLVPYLNEEIDFSEHNIPNIKTIFDLTKEIQIQIQAISIEPPKTTPILKPYQQKYTPISVNVLINKSPLIQFPFSCNYDDEILQTQDKCISNQKGILEITPIYVTANFQMSSIELQPDLDALTQNDSISPTNLRFLKSFIQLPKFNIAVSIQPINVYLITKELNFNKPNNNAIIKNLVFNKLKTNEISIINDSTQADYIVKIISNTNEDDNSDDLKKQFNLYLAQLNVELDLYNKEKQIIYHQSINDIYGYGTSLTLAGSNAYNSEKLAPRLTEALFYLKRKIVWY